MDKTKEILQLVKSEFHRIYIDDMDFSRMYILLDYWFRYRHRISLVTFDFSDFRLTISLRK